MRNATTVGQSADEQRDRLRKRPGERRTIRIELETADARGEKPRLVVEGFNIQEAAEE